LELGRLRAVRAKMPSFPKGSIVVIQGLQNAAKYNGQRGKVESTSSADGKITIALFGEGFPTIRCKPENLALVHEEADDDEPPDLISSSGEESDNDVNHKPVKPPVVPPARAQPPAQPARAPPAASPRAPPAASPRVNNEKPKPAPSQRQNSKPPPPVDNDSDGPPDLVSSSGDEDEPHTHPRQANPPKAVSAPKSAGAAKAGQPAASPVPASPAAQSRQTVPPAPPAPSVIDRKQQIQQLILKKTEEGRTAFKKYEYSESCQKFLDIIGLLLKLTPAELRENQSHLTRSYTWIAESHLQQGNHVESTSNGKKAVESWKLTSDQAEFDVYMQATLCCALAAKGQQDYRAACTQLLECENSLKRRYGLVEHELLRKARLARVWSAQYVKLPSGPLVVLERTDKKENMNRKGFLMKVSTKLVIALNNGTDQVVNIGDFREIQDSGVGHSRQQGSGHSLDQIVDGMSVVIGGIDTGPDYGLEGIVVNVEENKQVEGGKMCLVMLSEDSSKLVMVPIANLLVGEVAAQAVARRAALKGFEEKIVPEAAELYEILQECRNQGMSLKRILSQIRTLHPNWEVSEKRVKKYLKELEMGGPRSDSAASGPRSDSAASGAKTRSNTEQEDEECPEEKGKECPAEKGKECLEQKEKPTESMLKMVYDYVAVTFECPVCWLEIHQENEDGTFHHDARILTVCGHSFCDSCVADFDADRKNAFQEAKKNKGRAPSWPTCPVCAAEIKVDNEKGLQTSCGVKNYKLCDVIDILHNRTRPQGP